MLKGSLRYYGQSRKIAILMTRLISRMLITCPFDPDAVASNDATSPPISRGENIYKIKIGFCICVLFQKRVHSNYTYIAAVIIFISSA